MELEIKHLAPYLPYALKMQYVVIDVVEKTGILTRIAHDQELNHPTKIAIDYYDSEHIWMFKPILRPLSDICDTSSKWKEMASEMAQSNNDDYLIEKDLKSNQYLSYGFQTWLISNHFDVFGLIEQGLALDINTLKYVKDKI